MLFLIKEDLDFLELIDYEVEENTGVQTPTIWRRLHYAKLSLQRALLGAVTPNLRAVYIDVGERTKKLSISFFYDGEITDEGGKM